MSSQKDIRVRFAPSPTGNLHVGGARAALFNWLFARNKNGKFILRIEDTDKTRSDKAYFDNIIEGLEWLGLTWDEGPYFQSERLEIYQEFADKLLKQDKAYYEGQAIRFKNEKEKVIVDDLVHGKIEIDTSILDDLVLMKSDGLPAYNFACVVDDATMNITHIIRGDDHISNTPKQIPLYKALGFKLPKFAHVPLILGEDRSRLSKRHGATSITDYKKEGFLSSAMVNYLTLLGWSSASNKEVISLEDTIKEFKLSRVNKTGAVFDIEKLRWMNSVHIKECSADKLIELIQPFLKEKQLGTLDDKWFRKFVDLFKIRAKILPDFLNEAEYFFMDRIDYDREALEKFKKKPGVKENLAQLKGKISLLDELTLENTEEALRTLSKELGISAGELIHPSRLFLTGKTVGPGIFDIFELLGKDKVLTRLESGIKCL